MASFNGINFDIVTGDVGRKAGADLTITHIPGSNISYIDYGGATLRTQTFQLFFQHGSDALSFEAQVQQTGTLVGPDGSYPVQVVSTNRVRLDLSSSYRTGLQVEFLLL